MHTIAGALDQAIVLIGRQSEQRAHGPRLPAGRSERLVVARRLGMAVIADVGINMPTEVAMSLNPTWSSKLDASSSSSPSERRD